MTALGFPLGLRPKTTFSGDYKLVAIVNGLQSASCFHSCVLVKCYRIEKATWKKTGKYGKGIVLVTKRKDPSICERTEERHIEQHLRWSQQEVSSL